MIKIIIILILDLSFLSWIIWLTVLWTFTPAGTLNIRPCPLILTFIHCLPLYPRVADVTFRHPDGSNAIEIIRRLADSESGVLSLWLTHPTSVSKRPKKDFGRNSVSHHYDKIQAGMGLESNFIVPKLSRRKTYTIDILCQAPHKWVYCFHFHYLLRSLMTYILDS